MWLEDKQFSALIKDWWNSYNVNGWAGFRLSLKLKQLKVSIKDWIEGNHGLVESLKANLLKEMQALDIKEESQMLSDMEIAKKFKRKDQFERKV